MIYQYVLTINKMRRFFNSTYSFDKIASPLIFNSKSQYSFSTKQPAQIAFENLRDIVKNNPEKYTNKKHFTEELDKECKNLDKVLAGLNGFKSSIEMMKQQDFENFIHQFFVQHNDNGYKNMDEEIMLDKILASPQPRDTFIFPLKIISLRNAKKKEYISACNCTYCDNLIKNIEYKLRYRGDNFEYTEFDIHEYEYHNKIPEIEFRNVIQRIFINHICKKHPKFQYSNKLSNEENINKFYSVL
jgi:hypothetical protein